MTDAFEDWIGRSITRDDIITPRLAAEYRATLAPHLFMPADDRESPPGLHWALAPAILRAEDTGPDGAERKGLFLPPIPLSRRMWAGGAIETVKPLMVGETVSRTSTIAGIKVRDGRAGRLCVVSVRHDIRGSEGGQVIERQDLVFRDGPPKSVTEASPPPPPQARRWTVDATALLLFRFSAFTFNGHRIHYDPYHAAEEGYPGLVVHGPMQAALMLNLAAVSLGRVPPLYDYRCVAPLFAGPAFTVTTDDAAPSPHVRIIRHDGVTTAEAQAHARGTAAA